MDGNRHEEWFDARIEKWEASEFANTSKIRKKKALEESLVSLFDRENTNQVTINEVSIRFKMLANSKTLA